MGIYLNPGNAEFQSIRNDIYIDKSELIDFINSTIDTPRRLTCVSRPRRFGKSFAARMLCAYYDRSCDSRKLFDDLTISGCASYPRYLNQFHVIYLDLTWFISITEDIRMVVSDLQNRVIRELKKAFPGSIEDEEASLPSALLSVAQETKSRFFIIIDEWDALFREAKHNPDLTEKYLLLLRGLFKGGNTAKMISGAYMTGILPIKKYGTESALTDFQEYTMTAPDMLAPYVGFTECEVRMICDKNQMDFSEMKRWYDGYSFPGYPSVYSPNSVTSAIYRKNFRNYWTKTETYESLKNYISMNMDGLADAVIAMLGGRNIPIDILSFQNDLVSFRNRDDVLTLLIHLGYLAYDEQEKTVYIPNLEVSDSFRLAVQDAGWQEVGTALRESDDLLNATIRGECDTVADSLEKIHESASSILQYNNEASLSCAVTLAYYTAKRDYMIIREFPTGKGFADLAFIPRRHTDKPPMIIELKYNQSADSAIRQIKENRYDGQMKEYMNDLLLVGINYDKNSKSKKHTCVIEKA
ncbi:MAG: ATP-binding protein [Clostridiales bacterium]|nr:ATP-binding protein [Clostridiales bacterium]